jgi:hypothetical protein
MNKTWNRARCCALAAAAVAAIIVPSMARGEEPACPAHTVVVEGVPILGKIPYIGRLFTNVGVCEQGCAANKACAETKACVEWKACPAAPACPASHPCPAEAERIGIDFDFGFPIGEDGQCPLAIRLVEFTKCTDCKSACAGGACEAGVCAAGKCEVATACECPGTKVCCDSCQVVAKAPCCCGTKCGCGAGCQCGPANVAHAHGAHRHVGGCPAMFEHLLTLTAKSAALEAKLEARTEHAELVSEMLELAAENAKLKAQVELAEAKSEMQQQVLSVALENEQLKTKLAELTSKLENEAVRTARPATPAPR